MKILPLIATAATALAASSVASAQAMMRSDPRISEIRLEVELFQQESVTRYGRVTVNGVTTESYGEWNLSFTLNK